MTEIQYGKDILSYLKVIYLFTTFTINIKQPHNPKIRKDTSANLFFIFFVAINEIMSAIITSGLISRDFNSLIDIIKERNPKDDVIM
jgi:hypothetical protein